ncbi:hypothetical protein P7K49_035864 [Saguinus oedipus]|uniref:Uncharacterized protein n=1 Tax=Saguinus oedipus TaxID=9490 RepID=A0ABQ9TP64_SAGOE|nr:hypothetical protein P7K49_035864 [Saguinus oedipus]
MSLSRRPAVPGTPARFARPAALGFPVALPVLWAGRRAEPSGLQRNPEWHS